MPESTERHGGSRPTLRRRTRPLRDLRAERLLSIRELAEAADVAPGAIALIEAGRTQAPPRVIRRIAAAIGVGPEEVTEFRHAKQAASASAHPHDAAPSPAPPLTPADVLRRLEGVPPERPRALREALASTLELVAAGERLLEQMQGQLAQVRVRSEGSGQPHRPW
jgi:transcriptional regulator with XRE-family HTH domain